MGALDPYLIKKIMTQYYGGAGEDEDDLTLNIPLTKEINIEKVKTVKTQTIAEKDPDNFNSKINLWKELIWHQ